MERQNDIFRSSQRNRTKPNRTTVETSLRSEQICAKLEHAVAVVFERRLFRTKDCMRPCTKSMKRRAAQKIACGPVRTESMKRRADDGRTIRIHIPYIAHIAVPFMWGSLRLAQKK